MCLFRSGLKYAFPAEPEAVVRGVPTAHSAYPINEYIGSGGERTALIEDIIKDIREI
jgi:hypothetical protein